MGDEQIFQKISAPLSLINTYQINLISARSISLDSTFKTTATKRGPLPKYSLYTNTYPGACKHETFNPRHWTV
jgi:hypothetical protein